jgi:hypothetical protein
VRYLLLALSVVVLAGCRLSVDAAVDVSSDGGGLLTVSVATDADLERSAADVGADPLGRLAERVRQAGGGWRVEEREDDGGGRTVVLSAPFDDPAGFAARWEEVRAGLDAPEARLAGPLALAVDEGTGVLSVEGELPLVVTEVAAADLGTDVASLTAELADVVSSSLVVRTPGRVVGVPSAGAEVRVDGIPASSPFPDEPAEVRWRAAPGDVVAVAVTAEPGGGDLGRALVVGAVAALALALVAGGALAQRRRR